MKLYFQTRLQARTFAAKTNRKAPTTKDTNNKWPVKIK